MTAPARSSFHSAALATVDRFEAWGIAVFPGPYRRKGTLVKGWPSMPAAEAWALTREELRLGKVVNLAGRTGPTADGHFIVVLDCDRGDTDERVRKAKEAFGDSIIAIVRTGPPHSGDGPRGLHIWVLLAEPLRNARTPGGEVLGVNHMGRGHLVQVPPSRHPSGLHYEWILG